MIATIYDEALAGEPIPQIVEMSPTFTAVANGIYLIGDWKIRVPNLVISPIPPARRFVSDIRIRTGWSTRELARIVGTSHTTIGRIERGGRIVAGHSGELGTRLQQAHDVISRTYVIAGSDPVRTSQFLETRGPSGRSAVEYMREGEPSLAYLAIIDVATPRPEGLLVGNRPRGDGATVALHE